MRSRQAAILLTAALSAAGSAGCGSSSSSSSSPGGGAATKPSSTTTASQGGGAPALSGEAQSAATGDIPDNQVFLTFHDSPAGYRISFPEGWAQRGSADDVIFQDKNNIIHIVVTKGSAPTVSAVIAQLAQQRSRLPSLAYGPGSTVTIQGAPVVKVTYSTLSQPNPVTGKRVELQVDRYVYAHAGKVLVLDLGTPKGVDNVDAYRLISRSLRWA